MTALFTEVPISQQDRAWLAEQIKESARAAVEREAELNSPVITMQDAMRLAQIASPTAWTRWLRKWHVKSVGHGRYARMDIMTALDIESGKRGDAARARRLSISSK